MINKKLSEERTLERGTNPRARNIPVFIAGTYINLGGHLKWQEEKLSLVTGK